MKRIALLVIAITACQKSAAPPAETPPASPAPAPEGRPVDPPPRFDALARADVNRLAVRLNLPLFWVTDRDADRAIDPDEVASLLFYPSEGAWTQGGAFTPAFHEAWRALVAAKEATPPESLPAEERERRRLVQLDLEQGYPTLIHTDFTSLSPEERRFAEHIFEANAAIDALYARQNGQAALAARVPPDDVASQSLFRRNWGPECLCPLTEKNPACSAIPGAPKRQVDVYPAELQKGPKFCEALMARPDAKELMAPFVAVREKDGKLVALPYPEVFGEMKTIAAALRAAADALPATGEEPLKAYLRAAAGSFGSNDWTPADEAWSRMNATNSKWYLRVAPDETYWEPCAQKAGFHLTFARINPDSLKWQERLTPIQQQMENAVAQRAGRPYKARKVTFHLPDFIDIVTNAGDDRSALGATIGQSLPNWGPVANEGRGRTVAMSNLYTDPDSLAMRRAGAEALLSKESMAFYVDDKEPGLLSTVLHEACHNLGPSHEYKVNGKTDDVAFGGPLAAMLEELKSQTCGLFLVELARSKGILSDDLAKRVYTDSLVWAFGHISRGMWTQERERKPYSQLSAIQVGWLIDRGALVWNPAAPAANGTDKGAFTVNLDKLVDAVDALTKEVAGIKARGDKVRALKLSDKYVDGDVVPHKEITERLLRFPKTSFVYSVSGR